MSQLAALASHHSHETASKIRPQRSVTSDVPVTENDRALAEMVGASGAVHHGAPAGSEREGQIEVPPAWLPPELVPAFQARTHRLRHAREVAQAQAPVLPRYTRKAGDRRECLQADIRPQNAVPAFGQVRTDLCYSARKDIVRLGKAAAQVSGGAAIVAATHTLPVLVGVLAGGPALLGWTGSAGGVRVKSRQYFSKSLRNCTHVVENLHHRSRVDHKGSLSIEDGGRVFNQFVDLVTSGWDHAGHAYVGMLPPISKTGRLLGHMDYVNVHALVRDAAALPYHRIKIKFGYSKVHAKTMLWTTKGRLYGESRIYMPFPSRLSSQDRIDAARRMITLLSSVVRKAQGHPRPDLYDASYPGQ